MRLACGGTLRGGAARLVALVGTEGGHGGKARPGLIRYPLGFF